MREHIQIFLSIVGLLIGMNVAFAQSLSVVESESHVTGMVGSTLKADIIIKNTTHKEVIVKVEKLTDKLRGEHSAYFRMKEKITGVRQHISVNAVTLHPNETMDFTGFLNAEFEEGVSTVVYRFYNESNHDDYTDVEVKYEVRSEANSDKLFVNNRINIGNIYPNPASHYAAFDYRLSDERYNAVITIRNVLGSEIASYRLPRNETILRISLDDFKPGIYFYTLSMDDVNVVTKKFMVKK